MSKRQGIVNIRGKEYLTVARRVADFREVFKPDDGWAIRTWIVSNEGDRVVVSASICDKDDHVVATGYAEEDRTQGNINKTSALENAETSAIGRCLAAFGLLGEEYCSADELVNALNKQASLPASKPVEEQQQQEEQKPKPDPIERIKKDLGKMEELVGEEETRKRWVNLLSHSDHAAGALSLDDVIRRCNVTQKWSVSKELREALEAAQKTTDNSEEPF